MPRTKNAKPKNAAIIRVAKKIGWEEIFRRSALKTESVAIGIVTSGVKYQTGLTASVVTKKAIAAVMPAYQITNRVRAKAIL
jgi:hypothetical protein